jgi:NADP-dependent 3-hydroxy acid dehydrogenase YdfG
MLNTPRRSLRNHVAVVTGATSGIGNAIARSLGSEGARLVLVSRDEARLRVAAGAWPADAASPRLLVGDLLNEQDVTRVARSMTDEFKTVDILVHCAGAITLGRFADLSLSTLDDQYKVNVRAPFQLTQALLPAILAARGQIVFVNSSAGLIARAGVSQYGATKHALKALADSLREEVHGAGVRVISVFPGRTATPMQARVHEMESRPYDPDACLQPDDVASIIVSALTMPDSAEVKDISIRPMRE